MKIAIVYDWIDKWGGVERLLLTLHEQYPEADWYTSYVDKEGAPWAHKLHIKTSFIQQLPAFIRKNRVLSVIFYPYAFESFDLSAYDLVISVSSSFAKSVITKPHTKHICYLLTPTRFLWGMTDSYLNSWQRWLLTPILKKLRAWDIIAAQRPDMIITLSNHVSRRCEEYYSRKPAVLYPPFDIDYWEEIDQKIQTQKQVEKVGKFYLAVARAERYKKLDILIKLFNNRKDTLIIVGSGTKLEQLRQSANANIIFKQDITDYELAKLYSQAKALLMPQEEDFGYVALEAQYFGCPVLSFKNSGAAEIMHSEIGSTLVAQQSQKSFQDELERFEAIAYNGESRNKLKKNYFEQFSKYTFINTFSEYIKKI